MGGIRESQSARKIIRPWGKRLISRFGLAEGMFLAQYQVLRENGHSPSEAFNETVEEATQS